jgi:hypothetical protein
MLLEAGASLSTVNQILNPSSDEWGMSSKMKKIGISDTSWKFLF